MSLFFVCSLACMMPAVSMAQKEYKNKIPLNEENYDYILKDNIVTKMLDENKAESSENVMRLFFQRDGGVMPKLYFLIASITILMMVVVGAKLVFSMGKPDSISNSRKQLVWMILGLAVISIAEFIAFFIWDPMSPAANIASPKIAEGLLMNKAKQIKLFVQIITSGITLILLALSGYNLITAGGDEAKLKNEKQFLKTFFAGAGILLLSEAIVKVISQEKPEKGIFMGSREILGLVDYMLSFAAMLCTFMLVLAGIYYVSSLGNEDQMKRAKKIVMGCILAIVAIISSYAIVSFVIR